MHPYAEVWIELVPTEQGGRRTAALLGSDTPGRYRPHLRVGSEGELLGVAFVDGPDEPLAPGHAAFATVRFLYDPQIDYSALVEGAEFHILEGTRIVGHGRVTRR